jgi:pimeloyl-ACP methyl ester carboxylesterase
MIRHTDVVTNGVRLHVAQAGSSDGPLVVLLHGFPEFWYAWRRQIPFLADAGYRVWAPDQRGYNISEKPWGLAAYGLDALAGDVTGLIEAAGQQKRLSSATIGAAWSPGTSLPAFPSAWSGWSS